MAGSRLFILAARGLIAVTSILAAPSVAEGAEVAGTVTIDYQGLFAVDTSVRNHPVSVALFPGEVQRVVPRRPRTQRVDIIENRMQPAFVTVQKGDRVTFVNHDAVFHQLFSLSSSEPLSVQLAKADGDHNPSVTIKPHRSGTTHVFCRIHNKSYARIDVVETPYLQMVEPGRQFNFSGLAPGSWKLRLASPAAETQWYSVTALTAPPPERFTLVSRSGGTGAGKIGAQAGIEHLYRRQAGGDGREY